MLKGLIPLLAFIFIAATSFAQDNVEQNLAFQYYQEGEYEKAVDLFEELYNKDPGSNVFYRYLYNSLIYTKRYEELEKIIKKNIKKSPENLSHVVDLGNLYIQQGNLSKGKAQFNEAVKELQPNETQIIQLANSFINYKEFGLAAETYEKGQKLTGDSYLFSLELAELYEQLDEAKKSIGYYLNYLDMNSKDVQSVKNQLQSVIYKKPFADEFQSQLLSRIQKYPQIIVYPELLIWHYIQQQKFKAALIQSKALDKRLNENGYRLINLARVAEKEKDYDTAIESYQYVIGRGKGGALYMKARQELLATYKSKITSSLDYTQEDLVKLDTEFDKFIDEFGVNRNTANTIREKAQLQAFYLDNYDEAISLLEDLLNYPQIDKQLKGEFKLELGDFYIMKGEIWESALLYGQVDKEFKDEPLGEMARFKNAKLSYYKSEFEWAQAQLDVLKASTSELISNDALHLSVFIMDNLGLDTTLYPMQMFAKADLLYYQNKLDDALSTLDSVTRIFPDHSLADDIYYTKANIYIKKQDWAQAAKYLQKVIDQFSDDLLGDDATFSLAEIYQYKLNDKEKAQQLYQDLIFKYKDSIYLVESRKRYRGLRGDQL